LQLIVLDNKLEVIELRSSLQSFPDLPALLKEEVRHDIKIYFRGSPVEESLENTVVQIWVSCGAVY
jgi:hypothetical protein